MIRSSAKALIVREGKLLVNRCRTDEGEVYYDLPGGGQNPYETLTEAVRREVREETGFQVRVLRMAAIAEEIYDDAALRAQYPDYAHRLIHIFLAELLDDPACAAAPSELDWQQETSLWMPLCEADAVPFRPSLLSGKITSLVRGAHLQDLGSVHVR